MEVSQAQLLEYLRSRYPSESEKSLILKCGNKIVINTDIKTLYNEHADSDGFLYIKIY